MYTLEIKELKLKETETFDSIVDQILLYIKFLDDRYHYVVDLPEPTPEAYIPLDQITDKVLKEWFWKSVNREEIDEIFVEREKRKASSATKQQVNGEKKYKVKDHIKQWKPGKVYVIDEIVYYECETQEDTGEVDEENNPIMETVTHKEFYKIVQPHTSQAGWNPRDTSALFSSIVYFGDEGEQVDYPDWQQPQGAHDAYAKGRVVKHNGEYYISDVEANVWEPPEQWSVYVQPTEPAEDWVDTNPYVTGDLVSYNGQEYICISDHTATASDDPVATLGTLWEEYNPNSGSGGEEGGTTEPEAWVQPTGAHDAYNTGEQVTHNGSTWESNVDGNSWEPPTQWTEVTGT